VQPSSARPGMTFTDRGLPFPGFPRGWYQAGWSALLAIGDVRPLRYFDTDLVIYRSAEGKPHVLDAFCGHYGAHLGYGGTVEDSSIRCPYHGWLWDHEGNNIEVPYGDGRCSKRTIRRWHVVETCGIIFLWYSSDGSAPDWDPPSLPTEADRGYFAMYPGGTHEEVVNGDRRIWENMRYPSDPGPVYTREEAKSLRLVRKWTEQFYSGITADDDQLDELATAASERQE
jgi:phenylpropionate dioxygenase-like ring-hydroxylating dioxygenase large terminal subunit